jgi:hypothetical protein
MKTKRKPKRKLHLFAIVWGAIFTAFMLLTIGSKMIGGIFIDGMGSLNVHPETFVTWDDPGPYFFTYIIGYALIFWKPLWGSIIIMAVSIYYVIIAGVHGPPILAAPGFLVGALYLANFLVSHKHPHSA